MDSIQAWSIKIAAAAAPDEVDLAPLIAEAYVRGGKDRQELFHRPEGAEVGGFGVVDVPSVLPWILNGIALAAPSLRAMLSEGPWLKDLVTTVKDLLSVKNSLDRKKKAEQLSENPYAPMRRAMEIMSAELGAAGIEADRRDLIVYRVMRSFLEDPNGATQFVRQVAGSRFE